MQKTAAQYEHRPVYRLAMASTVVGNFGSQQARANASRSRRDLLSGECSWRHDLSTFKNGVGSHRKPPGSPFRGQSAFSCDRTRIVDGSRSVHRSTDLAPRNDRRAWTAIASQGCWNLIDLLSSKSVPARAGKIGTGSRNRNVPCPKRRATAESTHDNIVRWLTNGCI
jgi:hypothetical protein